jgi:flagellar biosynthesis regulator FlbT
MTDCVTCQRKKLQDEQAININGKRVSSLRKVELHMAPNVSVLVRCALLQSEEKSPRLIKQAQMLDEDGTSPLTNALGDEMLSEIQTTTAYYNKEVTVQ